MKRTALVIGGGPAGLSAGIGLARCGFEVEVHEVRSEWKGRVCGSFMNPDAVRALDWMRLLGEAQQHGAAAVLETTVVSATGAQSVVSTVQDGTPALAFQRRKLEELLAEELARCGGRLVTGSRVISTERRGNEWESTARAGEYTSRVHSQLVVQAGGRFFQSEVKRDGGWYGWNSLFCNVAQKPGEMAMFFGRRGYVGVLTFADGTTNVCGLTLRRPGDRASWEDVFAQLRNEQPGFDKLMDGARRSEDWHGVGPLPFTARPRQASGLLLAGDAGAVGDPFMGEGIGRALATGPLIAEAVAKTGLDDGAAIAAQYSALWRHSYSKRLTMGWAARWLLERPWLASRFMGTILRPCVISRATPIFHRGAGFAGAQKPAADPDLIEEPTEKR